MGLKHVGGYRMLRMVRTGSACEVWEVSRAEADPTTVMKLIPPGEYHTRENIALLKHEFAVGKKLKHPNTIRMIEFGSTKEATFLILEAFLHPNLKQHIQQGIQDLPSKVEKIIRGAAMGLGHLHSLGWVHRDVKPDNFLLDNQGNVKLIDFALATRSKGTLGKLFSLKSKVQGTRSYMSPEQIRGQAVDGRSDIYSLGCMFHELLAGKPPFTGSTTQELLTKHLRSRAPSLAATEAGVSSDFAEWVQQALVKEPSSRFASVEAMLEALDSIKIFDRPPSKPK